MNEGDVREGESVIDFECEYTAVSIDTSDVRESGVREVDCGT